MANLYTGSRTMNSLTIPHVTKNKPTRPQTPARVHKQGPELRAEHAKEERISQVSKCHMSLLTSENFLLFILPCLRSK
jgi:hypothetical protein